MNRASDKQPRCFRVYFSFTFLPPSCNMFSILILSAAQVFSSDISYLHRMKTEEEKVSFREKEREREGEREREERENLSIDIYAFKGSAKQWEGRKDVAGVGVRDSVTDFLTPRTTWAAVREGSKRRRREVWWFPFRKRPFLTCMLRKHTVLFALFTRLACPYWMMN